MKKPQDYIQELTNEQLWYAFQEIREFHETGILKNGITRDMFNEIHKINEYFSVDFVCKEITYEIAKRWFEEGL